MIWEINLTVKYVQLDEQGAKTVYEKLTQYFNAEFYTASKLEELKEYAKKYYHPGVVSFVLHLNSEYNDETYDNRLAYVIAYDKEGNEVVPLLKTASQARAMWETTFNYYWDNDTDNCVNDITIHLKRPNLPELYVKE